jgi:hypothetical protein
MARSYHAEEPAAAAIGRTIAGLSMSVPEFPFYVFKAQHDHADVVDPVKFSRAPRNSNIQKHRLSLMNHGVVV